MIQPIVMQSQINKSDFININFHILYLKTWVKIFTFFAIISLIVSAICYFKNFQLVLNSEYFFLLEILIAAAIYMPIITYFMSIWGFKTNKRLKEKMKYEFSETDINIVGESFSSRFDWDNLYKIKKIKGWILLYQSRLTANFIKVDDTNLSKAEKLIELIKSKNLKMN